MLTKIFFMFPPEVSHTIALKLLQLAHALRLTKFFSSHNAPCNVMGLHFKNPLGLAAGLDKNGDYIDALAALGFGFIEIGTVTPKPQAGNPKPRLFRLPIQKALINRMGFNNKGVDYLIKKVKAANYQGVLGINIGKNRETPLEHAADDYLYSLEKVYPYASYISINISSPNTPLLRDLQQPQWLRDLLKTLKASQLQLAKQYKKYVPLVVKISPDLSSADVHAIATILLEEKIDGVIATNTTSTDQGGLSGQPLKARSTQVIGELQTVLQNKIPIIACGGVFTIKDIQEKITAGAQLVQIYTGLIYEGPMLIKKLVTAFGR